MFDLFDWNGKKNENTYINIYYPKEMDFESLNLDLDMGSLNVSECNFDSISAKLDMGSFTAKDCYLGKIDIDLDMGSLELYNVSLTKLDANLDMGSAEITLLQDGENDYGYDLKVDMGSIEINGEDEGSKYKVDGDNEIIIDCDMGDIEIKEK